MRRWISISVFVAILVTALVARSVLQAPPPVLTLDPASLKEYVGVYRWQQDGFLYTQIWNEITGTDQLVALGESGEVRALYASDRDRFFAGPGAGLAKAIESQIEFQRDGDGRIAALTWRRGDASPRPAHRVDIEKREDVTFSNGDVRLAGTLIAPNRPGKHPAIVLAHASGPQNRDAILPFARFLVRRGVAVLGYDKRGVGSSTGDWNTASFEDLAGDIVAAFEYLKTRPDIDAKQIGLLGWSQAAWTVPIAAVRAKDIAFTICISCAAIPAAETTLDQARNEMTARGMKPDTVAQIVNVMKLQYAYAQTGEGWDRYAAAREELAAKIGPPPETFPASPDHPYFQFVRRLYFYDPVPALSQLRAPVLALFGELDNNILPDKNRAAWDAALKAGGHRDYTLRVLAKANHLLLEAKAGSNAEMPSLQRFVPEYFTTVEEWLAKRVRGFAAAR